MISTIPPSDNNIDTIPSAPPDTQFASEVNVPVSQDVDSLRFLLESYNVDT